MLSAAEKFHRISELQAALAEATKQINALTNQSDSEPFTAREAAAGGVLLGPVGGDLHNTLRCGEICRVAASGDVDALREALRSPDLPPKSLSSLRDYDNKTPLHLAAMKGHADAVQMLLEAGVDADAVDDDGNTALTLAQAADHVAVVKVLLACVRPEPDSYLWAQRQIGQSTAAGGARRGTSPMPQSLSPTNPGQPASDFEGLIVILVGLPGRGKSFVAGHIRRYFAWHGQHASVLTHQAFRQSVLGSTASQVSVEAERAVATAIGSYAATVLSKRGGIVVVDGTHSTRLRREHVKTALLHSCKLPRDRIIFVEVCNNNPSTIAKHVRRARKSFAGALQPDFEAQYYANMRAHEQVYDTLSVERDGQNAYMRLIEDKRLEMNRISGVGPTHLAHLLHNLRHNLAPIYLTVSGEYEDLLAGRLGGDSLLTPRGEAYSQALFEFMLREMRTHQFVVMTSTQLRSAQTAQHFSTISAKDPTQLSQDELFGTSPYTMGGTPHSARSISELGSFSSANCRVAHFPTLGEINYGDCDGQTMQSLLESLPNTMENIRRDPYNVSWPNGESVHQLFTARLEQHIHDIQASPDPVLVISHVPVIQGLLVYFGAAAGPQLAHTVEVPLNTLFKLTVGDDDAVSIETFDLTARVDELARNPAPVNLAAAPETPVGVHRTPCFANAASQSPFAAFRPAGTVEGPTPTILAPSSPPIAFSPHRPPPLAEDHVQT